VVGPARRRAGRGVFGRRRGLGLGFERGLGRADVLEPCLLVLDPVGQLVAAPVRPVLGVVRRVFPLRPRQPARDLGRERGLRLPHPAVAHRLVLGGVGLELGAVQRDVAELDQSRLPAQAQPLHEQPGQCLEMAPPELIDDAKVRALHPGHRHDVEALLARPGDPPRGVDALGVGVQQERHHHRRMVGRLAPLLPLVLRQDRREVQLRAHQMRRMARRHEVVDRRRQQPHLVHIPRPKGLAHARR
jgi:hypothetical protein